MLNMTARKENNKKRNIFSTNFLLDFVGRGIVQCTSFTAIDSNANDKLFIFCKKKMFCCGFVN